MDEEKVFEKEGKMIRFIEIGRQIFPLPLDDDEPINQFAWFDTITDTFMEFSGDQVWETWEEFEESFKCEEFPSDRVLPGEFDIWGVKEYLERFKGLYPKEREKVVDNPAPAVV